MVIVKVLRWVIGSGVVLTGGLSIASFALFIASDMQLWLRRSRMLRHWTFALVLLWFNVEIWGSVLHTLLTW
jgi:hypothetical protein